MTMSDKEVPDKLEQGRLVEKERNRSTDFPSPARQEEIDEGCSKDSINNGNSVSMAPRTEIFNEAGKNKLPKPSKTEPCPRCKSNDTKFCYFNNYNLKQPRFYCRSCQRYWTSGGILRDVPIGAGKRKPKRTKKSKDHAPDMFHQYGKGTPGNRPMQDQRLGVFSPHEVPAAYNVHQKSNASPLGYDMREVNFFPTMTAPVETVPYMAPQQGFNRVAQLSSYLPALHVFGPNIQQGNPGHYFSSLQPEKGASHRLYGIPVPGIQFGHFRPIHAGNGPINIVSSTSHPGNNNKAIDDAEIMRVELPSMDVHPTQEHTKEQQPISTSFEGEKKVPLKRKADVDQ